MLAGRFNIFTIFFQMVSWLVHTYQVIIIMQLKIYSSVELLSHVRLFTTPWIAACQASLSITNSRSSLKLMSIKSVMPSSHLILCHPLLLLPPIPPSIRVFSNRTQFISHPECWTLYKECALQKISCIYIILWKKMVALRNSIA